MRTLQYFFKKYIFLVHKKLKNPPQKVAYLWQFFLAAQTAQNSPELHFRFINSFIQPSRVESLLSRKRVVLQSPLFFFDA